MNALWDAARHALKHAGLWHRGARLLCAVSGGCDSIALLHTLCALRGEVPFTLMASHVQHGLRGEDSLADEQFVRECCQRLQVPLLVENAGLDGSMSTPGMETQARERRREIFLRQMEENAIDALMLAHHRDDQTETVLMHLLRGAGMEGLRGMQTVAPFGRGVVIRPFLQLPKQALAHFEHREDESNREAITPRNALRLSVLPQLETLFPGAGAHIAAAAETLSIDDIYLSEQADKLYRAALYAEPPLFMLSRSSLTGAPEALARRVLRLFWQEGLARCDLSPGERALSREDTQALYALLKAPAGASCNLPCGLMAQAGESWLHLIRQSGGPLRAAQPVQVIAASEATEYHLPHLHITQRPADGHVPKDASQAVLPPHILARKPVFRTPLPGDRIHPLGAPGAKPLRRFLTDRKIDPILRPALCVLAQGDSILWIPSVCTAEALRASAAADGSVYLEGTPSFLTHRS